MGLSSVFVTIPTPSGLAHRVDDCLPAGVDVHVLDSHPRLIVYLNKAGIRWMSD
jgi:hypothetical protein